MRLALSSSAAPDESLWGLIEACRRKGLAGLELVEGDEHGIRVADPTPLPDFRTLAETAAPQLTGFRFLDASGLEAPNTLRIASELAVPLLVPVDDVDDVRRALRSAESLTRQQARVVLSSRDARLLVRSTETAPALDLAWDLVPGRADADELEGLIAAAGPRLTHVRLFGGGPEAAGQGGMGVGRLMSRLALARFGGTLVVTPSTPRYRVAWSTWLGRRAGWGCSGKATPAEPIRMGSSGGAS